MMLLLPLIVHWKKLKVVDSDDWISAFELENIRKYFPFFSMSQQSKVRILRGFDEKEVAYKPYRWCVVSLKHFSHFSKWLSCKWHNIFFQTNQKKIECWKIFIPFFPGWQENMSEIFISNSTPFLCLLNVSDGTKQNIFFSSFAVPKSSQIKRKR